MMLIRPSATIMVRLICLNLRNVRSSDQMKSKKFLSNKRSKTFTSKTPTTISTMTIPFCKLRFVSKNYSNHSSSTEYCGCAGNAALPAKQITLEFNDFCRMMIAKLQILQQLEQSGTVQYDSHAETTTCYLWPTSSS